MVQWSASVITAAVVSLTTKIVAQYCDQELDDSDYEADDAVMKVWTWLLMKLMVN